jgi:hypothetical protein
MHSASVARATAFVVLAASTPAQCPPVSTHIGFHLQHVGAALAADGDEALFGQYRGFSAGVHGRGADDVWQRIALITGTSPTPMTMGAAVDLRGDTAVAGDPLDPSGTIVIAERRSGSWTSVSTFHSPGGGSAGFGSAVAVSDDRVLIAAGAPLQNGAGAAYVYTRLPNGWAFDSALAPAGGAATNDRFGFAVAVAGGRVFVGAPGRSGSTGAVYVFERRAGVWTQSAVLVPAGVVANDGWSSAIVADGARVFASAPGRAQGTAARAGEVVEHRLVNGTWTEAGRIAAAAPVANGAFGVALDLAGARLAVGGRGSAHVFDASPQGWRPIASFTFPDPVQFSEFGAAVAL